MKHIVSFSGGKDSTAMLLMMIEKGMQIDDIIYCDTTKEFPDLYNHINQVEKYIQRPITKLKNKSFDYYMFDYIKTKGKRIGEKGYAWPSQGKNKWCTSRFKYGFLKNYLNKTYGINNYIQYIGIAFDELERCKPEEIKKKYPLVDWKITEGEALKYCYDRGFDWGGLYTKFNRVSCWCCPFSNLKELRNLYIFYPNLWKQLKDMDNRSWNQFRKNESVQDLEDRFKKQLEKLNIII